MLILSSFKILSNTQFHTTKSSKHNLKKSCVGCSIAAGYTCIISNKMSTGQKDPDNRTHIAASGLCGGVFLKF